MKHVFPVFILFTLILSACGSAATQSALAPTMTSSVANPVISATTESATSLETVVPTPFGMQAVDHGALARGYLESLTSIGPRVAGSEEETRAAQYISEALSSFGYETTTQVFRATAESGQAIDSANVVAIKNGRSTEEIIVGAHYDSVGESLGADDNASGVATMLEVAELIKNEATPFTIRFIAFGAEEAGMLGSYAYLNQMSQTEFENTIAMINLDSLIAGDIAYVYSDEEPQATLRDWTLEWAFGNSLDLQTIHNVNLSETDSRGASDYAAFRNAGIPFVYFEATNWTLGNQDGYTQVDPQYGDNGKIWGTSYDTLEYLDATFPSRVEQHLNFFVQTLYGILTQYENTVQ